MRHTGIVSPIVHEILSSLKTLACQPLPNTTAMPKAMYVSPDILQLEIERLFYQEWICAGRSDEIPNAGDFMSFDLLDQPLILIRQKAGDGKNNGDIQAISNVCRHRMMRLVDGKGQAKKFTCPYHAWTYNLDGDLIAAPYMDRTDCFNKVDIKLPHVRTEVHMGWIYVSLSPDIAPVAEMLAPLGEVVAPYQMGNYVTIFTE